MPARWPADKDEIAEEADRLRSLAGSLGELRHNEVIGDEEIRKTIWRLEARAEKYEEDAAEVDDDNRNFDDEPIKTAAFDIDEFFTDL